MRGVLFTDAFNSRCQVVPLLLQRPGVVFAELKAEHLNKKEGGKPHSCEESKSRNVSCCECGTVSPAGIDSYWVLWGHQGPSSPCLQHHRAEMNIFSVLWAASEWKSLPFCQRTWLPGVLNKSLSWDGAWADKIPALGLYLALKSVQTVFLKSFVKVHLNREVKSSLTTLLRTQQSFVFPLFWAHLGPDPFYDPILLP